MQSLQTLQARFYQQFLRASERPHGLAVLRPRSKPQINRKKRLWLRYKWTWTVIFPRKPMVRVKITSCGRLSLKLPLRIWGAAYQRWMILAFGYNKAKNKPMTVLYLLLLITIGRAFEKTRLAWALSTSLQTLINSWTCFKTVFAGLSTA